MPHPARRADSSGGARGRGEAPWSIDSEGESAGVLPARWPIERGLAPVLARWTASDWVRPCFCADETRAARDAELAPLPATLAPELAGALRARGVDRLYAHQARAFEIARGVGG